MSSILKKCKVVIVSTNQKTDFFLDGETLIYSPKQTIEWTDVNYQFIYILSDEKIKPNTNTFKQGLNGNWFYNTFYKTIARVGDVTEFDFKIIATTNMWCNLPKPSSEFLEVFTKDYNKGRIIKEVMVKYEVEDLTLDEEIEGAYRREIIKVNTRDFTISIRRIKESWTRDEVGRLIMKYALEEHSIASSPELGRWIEDNL